LQIHFEQETVDFQTQHQVKLQPFFSEKERVENMRSDVVKRRTVRKKCNWYIQKFNN